MVDKERSSQKPKHVAVAQMVQDLMDHLNDGKFQDTYVSVYSYDASGTPGKEVVRVTELLRDYDTQSAIHSGETDFMKWDPLREHGGMTPIGSALSYIFGHAAAWVDQADGTEERRAIIYLLSDGMNNVGPDGSDISKQIDAFNAESKKGRIRLSTIGYFQSDEGADAEEDAGRTLLRSLPNNTNAYFESSQGAEIAKYIFDSLPAA
jgi:hypothetical protein